MSGRRAAPRVAGVVLAAGCSRRFAGNKLLAELDGVALVARVLAAARASRLDPVVVVLGHQHRAVRGAIEALLEPPRVRAVRNERHAAGQSSSVICGLAAVEAEADAAMFLMGDQPLIEAPIIDRLIAAFAAGGHSICYPAVAGRRRTPVIFARCHFAAIHALAGNVGARAIIEAHRDDALAVEFAEEAPFRDVDRSGDLEALRALHR